MAERPKLKDPFNANPSQLYIAIDHLKEGIYHLNIMNKNNVVKTIEFKKSPK